MKNLSTFQTNRSAQVFNSIRFQIIISRIPNKISKMSINKCPICLGQLTVEAEDLCCTPCGHIVHSSCLQTKLNGSTICACPTCLKSVNENNVIMVYPTPQWTEESSGSGKQKSKIKGTENKGSKPKPRNSGDGDGNGTFPKTFIKSQVVNCGHETCRDNGILEATLVNDYNETLKVFMKQNSSKEEYPSEMETLQQEIKDIELIQKKQIAILALPSGTGSNKRAADESLERERKKPRWAERLQRSVAVNVADYLSDDDDDGNDAGDEEDETEDDFDEDDDGGSDYEEDEEDYEDSEDDDDDDSGYSYNYNFRFERSLYY